mmetsp:Transcript_37132/g.56985  ORF Transcript_37132/g.56985 Transcript_37132/m.56985 type:complete len:106 (+) Transcript_37132:2601-2918(+)
MKLVRQVFLPTLQKLRKAALDKNAAISHLQNYISRMAIGEEEPDLTTSAKRVRVQKMEREICKLIHDKPLSNVAPSTVTSGTLNDTLSKEKFKGKFIISSKGLPM